MAANQSHQLQSKKHSNSNGESIKAVTQDHDKNTNRIESVFYEAPLRMFYHEQLPEDKDAMLQVSNSDVLEKLEERQELSSYTTEDIWALSSLEPAQETKITDYKSLLKDCLFILETSPTACSIIEESNKDKWHIGFDTFLDIDFHIEVQDKLILLSDHNYDAATLNASSHYKNTILLALIRSFRDVWQEKRHGAFDERFSPEAILMHERIRAADCEAITTLIAWELRSEGYGDLWRTLLGSDNGDLAMSFSKYLERNPSESFSYKALSIAFDCWFMNQERVNACDHQTLEYMDEVMDDYDGKNPFGKESLEWEDVEILSCLPNKTAYLLARGEDILADPYYAGMDDIMNQTHLFHIMRDLSIVYVDCVGFQDEKLARRIFPSD